MLYIYMLYIYVIYRYVIRTYIYIYIIYIYSSNEGTNMHLAASKKIEQSFTIHFKKDLPLFDWEVTACLVLWRRDGRVFACHYSTDFGMV